MINRLQFSFKYLTALLFISFTSSFFAQSGTCANPIPLTCGTPFTGTTTDGASNFDVYSCGSQLEEGKEKIHTITLTQTSDIIATLSGMTVDLDIHILSACNTSSCITRDDVSASANGLVAGTYYIVVDGFGAAPAVEGAYTLDVSCSVNTIGTCGDPVALACGIPYSGNTTGFSNNLGNYSCSSFDKIGPEVIHTITSTGNGTLTATLTRQSGEDLEVGILSACNETSCLDITTTGLGSTVTASISNAVAGQQYYIVVDGDETSDFGTYTLDVTCPSSSTTGDCANPIALTCGTPFTGTTVDGVSNFDTYGCPGGQLEEGKEKIHTITITQNSDLTATLSGMSVDLDVHILSSCDANSCLARNDISATATGLAAGTYYVVVDGFGAAPAVEGAYTLEVTCTPNSVSGTCANPIALTCGSPYTGSTTGLTNTIFDYTCSVFDNVGPEAIHVITPTISGTLTATLTRPSGMDMEVAILSACAGNTCLDKTVLQSGTTIAATINNAVAGQQYYIVVDGDTPADNGQYTLEVTCPQGTSGNCANPIALTCGTPFTGTTVDGVSNFDTYGCPGGQLEEGKEKIHTITIAQSSDLTATLSGMTVDLDVHILASCDANSCLARNDISATATSLAPGTYYIVVDGFGAAPAVEGAYTLEVTCTANNTSGTCGDPIALSCGTPYSGNTTGFLNNLGNYSCSSFDKIGPEVIHTITSPGNGTLTATLTRQSGEDLEVGILSACNETSCLDITTAGLGSTVTASISNAVAGQQYYIVVDGDETGDFGTYTLDITCPQSTTTGDCTNPIALTCGTPFTGTTTDGLSNFDVYGCGVQQEEGKEKIHTIVLTQASDITATLSGMTVDLDVHILSACDANSCIARDDISASATGLAAGTYYVVVDGFGAAPAVEGAYTLEVTCTPVNGGGGSGTCGNPIALTCGTPFTGTTADGVSNFDAYSCGAQQEEGKEKIHTIILTQASNITAALSGMTADLDVQILSACDENTCLGRDDVSATVNALAAGTYYVVVDGFGAAGVNEGAYTLEVTCTPVGGGGGSGTCANPIALTCGTPFTGTTADGVSNFDAYSCGAQQEEGKEKIHTIVLTQASNITAALSGMTADLDIQVLSACDENTCLGRDDVSATVNALAAGTYYIVVDGFGAAGVNEGAYTVEVTCTPVGGGSGCSELFFSEYVEGSSNNKAVEIYNPTNAAINLSNYRIEVFSNGASAPTVTIPLSGSIASYGTHVVANNNSVAGLSSLADMSTGSLSFNGDDAVVLLSTTDTVDIFGKIGEDPGTEWVNSSESSLDKTLYRLASVTQGVSSNPTVFNPSTEWVALSIDDFTGVGSHTSNCQNGCTPNGATLTEAICQGDSYVLGSQTLTVGGTYTETLTNVGGCDSVVNLTLTVNPLPSISAGNDLTINNGDAVTLSGNGGTSYSWNNGVNDGVAFTPGGTNSYIVTGTDANGCQNTDTVTVTVNGGVTQPCSELFISEYLEGSASNKALEIYNPSSGVINLSSYSIGIFANGGSTASTTIPLSGTLAANSTFVIVNNGAANNLLALATIASGSLTFNGDDAVVLLKNSTDTIDIVGKVGEDPGSNWLGGTVSTQNMTLVRKASVQIGVNTNPASFDPSVEWDALALDDITNIGTHSSSCSVNPCVDQITQNETICEGANYVFDGQTLTVAGTYTQTLTNVAGCDSITTLNLTVTPTQFIVEDTICAGSSYVLGTQTLTTTGTYLETFQGSMGCDSVVLLGLTVTNPFDTTYSTTTCTSPYVFGTQTITQNGTYTEVFQTGSGCDSTVTLNITLGNVNDTTIVAEICQGETYVFGTQNLTTTGSYSEVFSTSGGCDSTVSLTLSVKATPLITITENNGDLVSSNGTSYQWLLNGDTIQGATAQNYTPTSNGLYSVITTAFNGCNGTGTYDLQNVSIKEALQNSVSVIPNPSKGIVTITANDNVSVIVYNIIGEVVLTNNQITKVHILDLTQNERGVYMVKITDANNITIIKRVVLN